jgi:hypothetical protein
MLILVVYNLYFDLESMVWFFIFMCILFCYCLLFSTWRVLYPTCLLYLDLQNVNKMEWMNEFFSHGSENLKSYSPEIHYTLLTDLLFPTLFNDRRSIKSHMTMNMNGDVVLIWKSVTTLWTTETGSV